MLVTVAVYVLNISSDLNYIRGYAAAVAKKRGKHRFPLFHYPRTITNIPSLYRKGVFLIQLRQRWDRIDSTKACTG